VAASATGKDTGVSVKKVKRIIDLVRGKKVNEALEILQFQPSPIASRVAKLVRSATANAENELLSRAADLKIVEIYANEGSRLKRFRPRARGRTGVVKRRNSHITVVVDEEQNIGE